MEILELHPNSKIIASWAESHFREKLRILDQFADGKESEKLLALIRAIEVCCLCALDCFMVTEEEFKRQGDVGDAVNYLARAYWICRDLRNSTIVAVVMNLPDTSSALKAQLGSELAAIQSSVTAGAAEFFDLMADAIGYPTQQELTEYWGVDFQTAPWRSIWHAIDPEE